MTSNRRDQRGAVVAEHAALTGAIMTGVLAVHYFLREHVWPIIAPRVTQFFHALFDVVLHGGGIP